MKITLEDFNGYTLSQVIASHGENKMYIIANPSEGTVVYRVFRRGEVMDFPISRFQEALDYYNC